LWTQSDASSVPIFQSFIVYERLLAISSGITNWLCKTLG
jgi:hypothetical protein